MEYKKTTIFEKYKINPDLDKAKIKMLFQTDPNKRKDLPVVLKVITNDEKLFEEELFTTHKDNKEFDSLNRVLEILDSAKKGYIYSEIDELSKKLKLIIEDESFYKKFFYSTKLSEKKANDIYIEFINCLLDRIMHEFYNSIGELKNDELKKMYNAITNIFSDSEKFGNRKEDFDEDLCDYLNNSLTLDATGRDLTNRLISLISLNKVLKNDFYTNSVKYLIEKMSKDLNKYADTLIDIYEQICKSFNAKDLKEISSFITLYISTNLCLRAEKSPTEYKKNYKNLKKIQYCAYLYQKHKSKTEENKDFDLLSDLCDYFVLAGEEWYSEYNEAIKNLINNINADNMYEVVSIITSENPNDEVLRIFANVLTDVSGFNRVLEYILNTHEASVNHTSDKYINPIDVDNFIAMYYWLVYTKFDSNITKTFFDNIRGIGFDILATTEELSKQLENRFLDSYTRNNIRRRILNTYEVLPGDWVMSDGITIREMFARLGEPFNGSSGESADMIVSYNSLFKELKKRINKLVECPECGYTVDVEDETCPKCSTGLDWSDYEESDDEDDDDDEETNTSSSTSYSSSSSSDNSGCLIWFIIAFIIFIIIVAANS